MAIVKPFRALRPQQELVSRVACPPYDVLSSEEARLMARGNPISFLHVAKSEIDLDPSIDIHDEKVYRKAEENFGKLIREKVLVQDEKESFYIYKQVMGMHEQIGLLACCSVDDYEKNVIKKHELTRPDKEDDRTRHISSLNANTGLVFLSYKAEKEIDLLIAECMKGEALFDFTRDDAVRHTIWRVDDQLLVKKIVAAFAEVKTIYVADGHHRTAAACRVRQLRRSADPNHTGLEEYNYFLGALFPDDQVQIMSYNRAVRDLNSNSPDAFLVKIKERKFSIHISDGNKPYAPEKAHHFGMYVGAKWYMLAAHQDLVRTDDPVESLDVQILQKNILGPILGIDDPRTNKRIDFIGGIRGLDELMKKIDTEGYGVAFSLCPTSITDLMRIADAGKIMPPKSTWFEPKLLSGMIMHLLQ